MGTYSIETLVRKWGRGELTLDQTVGQILLRLQDLQDTVTRLERRLYRQAPDSRTRGEEGGS